MNAIDEYIPNAAEQAASPYSIEAEEVALGHRLFAPERATELIARCPSYLFFDERSRLIDAVTRSVAADGQSTTTLVVYQRLKDAGKDAAVGGMAYISGLADVATLHDYDSALDTLKEKHRARTMVSLSSMAAKVGTAGRATLDDLYFLRDGCDLLIKQTGTRASRSQELDALLAKCEFDASKTPPPLRAIYSIGDVPTSTPGNITSINAHVKAGKSAFVAAHMAATMRSPISEFDTLGVSSNNDHGRALVHFDTEQSPDDHWHLIHRAMRRAGVFEKPDWLLSYCLTGKSHRECWELVEQATERAAERFGRIHSVLIDGTAELVCNVNDPDECNDKAAKLHALAIHYDCPIVGVLHLNPGTEKSRGHWGSQLERKSETNLRLDKDGEATVVWSDKQRRAPIPKDHGPRFRWNAEAGMHLLCDSMVSDKEKAEVEQAKMELDDVYRDKAAMRYTDIKVTLIDMKIPDKTAERKIKKYIKHALIKKSFGNLYERSI